MNGWLLSQETPSNRFTEPNVWEDDGIYQRMIEELTLKRSIQTLLEKLVTDKNKGELSSGESFMLHNFLMKYEQLKKCQTMFLAMNVQSNQMKAITDNLSIQQNYLTEINKKRKAISKLSRSQAPISKQLDIVEKKLIHDIDKIDSLNVVASVDNAIKPVTTQLEEDFHDALYNINDGILGGGMKNMLASCMPPLPNGQLDPASASIIAEECLKRCVNKQPILMKDIPVTQYHFPTVPTD